MPTSPPATRLTCPGCGAPSDPAATRCAYCEARLATVACPKCFAPMFAGSRHCAQCGARGARQEGGAGERKCPHCHVPMHDVRIGALETSECERCDGLWLAADAFERLCADGESQAAVLQWEEGHPPQGARAAAVRYRPCPGCGKFMNRVNFARISGVVLDVCRKDGVFFDRRELHQVVSFLHAGGLERSRARQREQLAEEERRLRARQLGQRMESLTRPRPMFEDELPSSVRLDFATLVRVLGGLG